MIVQDGAPERCGLVRTHIPTARCAELAGHIGYLARNRRRMRYATARVRGFPIGSGVTVGACKSVVPARFKRSGQRWSGRGLSDFRTVRGLSTRLRSSAGAKEGACMREIRVARGSERVPDPDVPGLCCQ